ncbi:hypothetical protein TD95_001740 [Thielaviopsis punctulata]|uniref:Class E vacuolar protein-sorting machinery protein HSE1 n=1 Tax=Thielaviopsis punctulata TaxID=72032 RepID=A0A0F4ZBZ1_9PEZI|nr:hypothetical protein TD95_001740 [Thielaviopsis punctulata]
MFRAATVNPYDEAVAKATDETLTSEDWGAIIDLCDRVSNDDKGPKDVIQSVIKRLTHRNANVQLYTLELANALSQNCGKPMHREMASRAFTEALLKLANDRNTHSQVKPKILQRMKDWTDMFSDDPDLGIMKGAYMQLKQSNPMLEPPSAPQKNHLTDLDRQREEDDLQKALQLSLQDEEQRRSMSDMSGGYTQPSSSAAAAPAASAASAAQTPEAHVPVSSQGTTAATVSRVRAMYDFAPSEEGELEFKKGDIIAVLESVYKDWWRGSLRGQTGIFPLNYVEKLTDPTPEELQREAMMEAEVFSEIRNVEKLLTLLSTSSSGPGVDDNEEISKLYQRTTAIRPKLIKLIEKYSQKKDDFTQLNEKFIKARRDYETLLEASMAHPPQHSYHQYPMGQQAPQPGYSGPRVGGYAPPQAPAQPGPNADQRYYNNVQDPQYAAVSSPPPAGHYHRGSTSTPAPFFMAGVEVPAAPTPTPPQPQQTYPIRPAGTTTSASSPPPQAFHAYAQPTNSTRPQSTYGAQELATSVYDTPINPTPASNPFAASSSSTPSATASAAATASSTSPPPPQPGAAPVPFTQPQPPAAQFKTYQPATAAIAGVPGPQPGQTAVAPGGQYRPYVPPSEAGGGDDAANYYRSGGGY